jgi:hypothetical protein
MSYLPALFIVTEADGPLCGRWGFAVGYTNVHILITECEQLCALPMDFRQKEVGGAFF